MTVEEKSSGKRTIDEVQSEDIPEKRYRNP